MIGLVIFALRFPYNVTEPEWGRLVRMLPALASILFIQNLASFGNLFGLHTQALTYASYFAVLAVILLVILILVRRRRHLSPQDDQRMRWVIAGCALGVPAFVIAELAQSAGLSSTLFGYSEPSQTMLGLVYLLYGVLAWFVSEAVRRPRIVNVGVPLRHGMVMALLSMLVAVPVFALHEWIGHHKDVVSLPEWAWLFVAGPLLILILHHLHEGAVHLADRLFSRRYHRAQHCLIQTEKALKAARNPETIDRRLAENPCTLMHLASGAVFRQKDDVFQLRPGADGWRDEDTRALRAADIPVLVDPGRSGKPRSLAESAWFHPDWPEGLARPCLAVPIQGGSGLLLGIALYGAHQTGSDLDAEERIVLAQLAETAANALERVEIETLRREVSRLRALLGPAAMVR